MKKALLFLLGLVFAVVANAGPNGLKYFGAITYDGWYSGPSAGNLTRTWNTSNAGSVSCANGIPINMITGEFDSAIFDVSANNPQVSNPPLPLNCDWTYTDTYLQFAKTNNMAFQWYWTGTAPQTWWYYIDPSKVQAAWVDLLKQTAAHVGSQQIVYLNLINEVLTSGSMGPNSLIPNWCTGMGGTGSTGYDYVVTAYSLARQYLPSNFKLGINDAYNEGVNGYNYAAFNRLVSILYSRGLLDWIGLEGYNMQLNYTDEQVQQALAAYASNFPNLEIHITEFSPTCGGPDPASGPQQVANYWERFMINDFIPATNVTAVSGPWWPTSNGSAGPFNGAYCNAYLIDDRSNPPAASPTLVWLQGYIPGILGGASQP
jgi:hypothetical protein